MDTYLPEIQLSRKKVLRPTSFEIAFALFTRNAWHRPHGMNRAWISVVAVFVSGGRRRQNDTDVLIVLERIPPLRRAIRINRG